MFLSHILVIPMSVVTLRLNLKFLLQWHGVFLYMYIDKTYVWYWVSEMNKKLGGGGRCDTWLLNWTVLQSPFNNQLTKIWNHEFISILIELCLTEKVGEWGDGSFVQNLANQGQGDRSN